MPTYEECYYAMLVYSSMFNMDHRILRETLLAEKQSPEIVRKLKAENSFSMFKTALSKSPKDYLGWNNDPANPEYQRFRKAGENLLNKVIQRG